MSFGDELPADSVPYARGSETSRASAEALREALSEILGRVFDFIAAAGEEGATCWEVEQGLQMPHQTASARIKDLKDLNRIEATGRTRAGRPLGGARARPVNVYVALPPDVWRATKDARPVSPLRRYILQIAGGVPYFYGPYSDGEERVDVMQRMLANDVPHEQLFYVDASQRGAMTVRGIRRRHN